MSTRRFCIAYYCSGHGYGHATRVSAFACHLLAARTGEEGRNTVHIVSSAPRQIFADALDLGALYRYAEIDPVVVQPIAYRVDRRQSLEVLKKFLGKKQELLQQECEWLQQVNVDCVLSDAPFLACLAAKTIGIPSVLLSNFSFDSVYSYFSTPLSDVTIPSGKDNGQPKDLSSFLDIIPDEPIPYEEIAPFVNEIQTAYRCADLLVRLPGHIPIPSFYAYPSLPSSYWVSEETRRLKPKIMELLCLPFDGQDLLPRIDPFTITPSLLPGHSHRKVIQGPLLVRSPSARASVYTVEGRSALLTSIGVPAHLHDPSKTKILVVSFGGQTFKRPRTPSMIGSRRPSETNLTELPKNMSFIVKDNFSTRFKPSGVNGFLNDFSNSEIPSRRLATSDHLWIPGAPPAANLKTSPTSPCQPFIPLPPFPILELVAIPPTPNPGNEPDSLPQLLPHSSWIAIVCGVSREQWESFGEDEYLPEEFYVAPRNVYMPDLTAVGDTLLGKLGYGTVSECVDACTPFVYVSRPLFIEEHGLRLLLEQEGTGVELSRQSYEAGDWATAVNEAYLKGKDLKEAKRRDMESGVGITKREEEIRNLACEVLDWVSNYRV